MAIFNKRHVEIIMHNLGNAKRPSIEACSTANWLNANFNINVTPKQVLSKYRNECSKLPRKPKVSTPRFKTVSINMGIIEGIKFVNNELLITLKL